jgi:hypothetical protein
MEAVMTGQTLERQTERAVRQRWWLMVFYVLGWLLWQLFTVKPVARLAALENIPVLALQITGAAVWTTALILMFRFMAHMRKNRALAGVLNDELAVANRRRCWAIGYFALLAALVPAVVASAFQAVDALTLAQLLMMVAVSVPLLAFVWLERDAV